jgi:hypothetical protein
MNEKPSEEISKSLREWCLEIDAPLLEEDLRQAADTIERLTRERDEARAEAEEATARYLVASDVYTIKSSQAEGRGFERGVREAAEVLDKDGWSFPRDAVLALLEPKKEGDA